MFDRVFPTFNFLKSQASRDVRTAVSMNPNHRFIRCLTFRIWPEDATET